jgi:hypothetical protein
MNDGKTRSPARVKKAGKKRCYTPGTSGPISALSSQFNSLRYSPVHVQAQNQMSYQIT